MSRVVKTSPAVVGMVPASPTPRPSTITDKAASRCSRMIRMTYSASRAKKARHLAHGLDDADVQAGQVPHVHGKIVEQGAPPLEGHGAARHQHQKKQIHFAFSVVFRHARTIGL